MNRKELEWLVNEIVNLRLLQKRREERGDIKGINSHEMIERYHELEKQYSSLKDTYEATVKYNIELQNTINELKKLMKPL